jgi:hypothetical protein
MENYAAQADACGNLIKGTDGKLVKGNLLRVFVMGKNPGWGQSAPEGLKNGHWICSACAGNGGRHHRGLPRSPPAAGLSQGFRSPL